MPALLRRPGSASARPSPGRSSPDRACAPAEHGSYREARTDTISQVKVSTLSGEPHRASGGRGWPLRLVAVRGRCCTHCCTSSGVTPCLQIELSTCGYGAELVSGSPLSDRNVPLVTEGNGTLMARRS